MKRTGPNILSMLALAFLIGCGGEPADRQQAEETGQEESMEMAATAQEIEVMNPMPHAMVVYASTDGEEMELGTVPANESSFFTITEPRGTMLQLRAEDEGQTHEVTGTVNLQAADEARWTIGAGEQ